MEARPVLHVVCALIEDDAGRLLVARRPVGKHLGGMWEFPGGKLEPGETAEDALRREIGEELGCPLRIGRMLRSVTHTYPTMTVRLTPFLARLLPGGAPPKAREHEALRWVTAREVLELAMPDADTPILKEWMALREDSDS